MGLSAPTLPPSTQPIVDNTGTPTQPFTQYLTQLNALLSSLISALTSSGSSSGSNSGGSNSTPVSINTQTANYALKLSDAGNIVEMNVSAANIVTIPTNATVSFPVGTVIAAVVQIGTGQTRIVGASGVTLRIKNGYSGYLATQYSAVTLYKRGTNEWVVAGDMSS